MILLFVAGFFLGALSTLVMAILFLFNVFGKRQAYDQFPAQIPPNKTRIPTELKAFLRSAPDGNGSEWESCSSMSLLLHFLFQEHKDTRQFRRWLYKKLQLELNDVTARSSAAGRIIQGIQIRDLEAGTNSPIVKNVRVEAFRLVEDDPDMFEELVLLLDLEYHGGFQMSVDALMAFGKFAQLSVKLLHLSGRARVTVKRQPFAHWCFTFIENPQMELKIESQFQGRNLRHLIPLIGSAFRKVLQLKHVWPYYKLRFRPLFQNPLLNPSPNFAALEHIELAGTGLEVTVLCSSRLNTSIGAGAQWIYCKVSLEKRPFGGAAPRRDGNGIAAFRDASHLLSVLLAFSRKGQHENLGVTFASKDGKEVRVEKVEAGSNAEKCGFRKGDCLVAVNNIPVRNERQASRLLTGTAGDLLVLVEREMEHSDREPTPSTASPTPELPSASSKMTESADNFELPDTPPMEIRARDEPEQQEMMMHWSIEENIEKRKSLSKEEPEALEMLPITPKERRPNWLQKTPRWESKYTPISVPALTSRIGIKNQDEVNKLEKHTKKGKAMLKHIARRGNSFRVAKLTRHRRMRRSRSESSLVRMELPEVKIQGSEEELERKWDESVSVVQIHRSPDETSLCTEAEKASISTGGEESAGPKEADKEKHASKRERFQAWVDKTLDKTKPILNRRKPPELAVEANDELAEEHPCSSSSTMNLLEKPKDKKKKKKSKSPSPSINNTDRRKSKSVEGMGNNKRTKSVPFGKNPIWGQSLHFSLQRESLYLNLLVYGERDDDEDQLLGYTSVYVPRIVDDCMLTLSNCHRERFHLKGPKESENLLPAELEELSRHNGFDPRLCFGDLLLGFRFFPEGLPIELGINETETVAASKDVPPLEQMQPSTSSQSISPPISQAEHKWITLHTKIVGLPCGLCGGKLWLKGSRCERCQLLCHHSSKCQERARTIECRPNPTFSFNDDSPFEELDPKELVAAEQGTPEKPKESVLEEKRKSATAEEIRALPDSAKSGCRRRRIADNIRERIKNVGDHIRKSKVDAEHIGDTKWSSLSTKGSESPESPILQNGDSANFPQPLVAVSEVLDPSFLASLEGFPVELRFSELRFEPGNAYNPNVICEAKQKGQHVFGDYTAAERKARINSQIDRVQTMIEKVTRERRSMPDKNSEEFDQVDNRLQALALVMLLYCSGLSDCVDKEEEENKVANNGKVNNAMENGEIREVV